MSDTVLDVLLYLFETYTEQEPEAADQDVLRDEWGFDGFVVSDWGAVHDRVRSLAAGLDLEMPGPKQRRVHAVIEAVRDGQLDEAVLDEAVRRILRIVLRAAATVSGVERDPGEMQKKSTPQRISSSMIRLPQRLFRLAEGIDISHYRFTQAYPRTFR